jgi:Asp-tRNA(Asn)/Glu-tRNA(Gln) amidotransferase B subunit
MEGKSMSNMDYRLFPDEEVAFICNIDNRPIDGWETIIAQSPLKAAKKYLDELGVSYGDFKSIYVLRPGENPGVDKPLVFLVGNIKKIDLE